MSLRTPLTFNSDGVTAPVDATRCPWNSVYLKGDGGVLSAGVVTVQTAYWETPDAAIPEAAWVTTGDTINATGATLGATAFGRVTIGSYMFLRLKITTPLSGGGSVTGAIVSTLAA